MYRRIFIDCKCKNLLSKFEYIEDKLLQLNSIGFLWSDPKEDIQWFCISKCPWMIQAVTKTMEHY